MKVMAEGDEDVVAEARLHSTSADHTRNIAGDASTRTKRAGDVWQVIAQGLGWGGGGEWRRGGYDEVMYWAKEWVGHVRERKRVEYMGRKRGKESTMRQCLG